MITVTRTGPGATAHTVRVRGHEFQVDMSLPDGADAGPDPHDLYDAALGACKALTLLWYARRNGIEPGNIEVAIQRDASAERAGTYRLHTVIQLDGALTETERAKLLSVAEKCPVHRLMTQVETEISTVLAEID